MHNGNRNDHQSAFQLSLTARHLSLTTRVQPSPPRRLPMKTTLIASAMAAAVSFAVTGAAFAGPAAVPGFDHEKCYGVAKAGKNDCQTATHSCAGTATKDAQGDSWVYVPAGTCDKLAGGSAQPKA
jgi:uncharacterized membrane protein